MSKLVYAVVLFLVCVLSSGVAYSYEIPAESNMVRIDATVSNVLTSSGAPAWAALVVAFSTQDVARLDCGNLAEDRGCFELEAGDRVLIYGHLRSSGSCGYDPPCTEIQVDNIRRYNDNTDVWSLWDGDSWEPGI